MSFPTTLTSRIPYYFRSAKHLCYSILKSGFWTIHSEKIQAGQIISDDFFGINIAPSKDPRVDDFIIEQLNTLGVPHVRMNFSYQSLSGDAERLLKRVLSEGFTVLLDVIPPFEEAQRFDAAAQERWAAFLVEVAGAYGQQVLAIEIGSTPNRGRWSGFEPKDYLIAWKIANERLSALKIPLLGPNVSDFEPLCSIQLLSEMQRQGYAPAIYTNNLFVERVIEPEAFDHRVLGRLMTRVLKLNLVKKARVLKAIGQDYGVDPLICTYKCWSSKRLSRWSVVPEQKKSDYLIRYLVIAATTGALERVYWGPLVCHRDGLIDDGSSDYPVIDNVTFYKQISGDLTDFDIREAFHAYGHLIKRLSGARCQQAVNSAKGLHHFIFQLPSSQQLHIVWTRDRNCIDGRELYNEDQLQRVTVIDALGDELKVPLLSFGERPVFLLFDAEESPLLSQQQLQNFQPKGRGVIVGLERDIRYQYWQQGGWQGWISVKLSESAKEKTIAYEPKNLVAAPRLSTHRDQRNLVWSIADPSNPSERIVIKQNRAKGFKKLSYRFKASKGQRHWNNAWEMRRRGINSPMPLAYFEQIENSGVADNYYVCAFVDADFSVRDAFTAFSTGAGGYQSVSRDTILKAVADFSCHMHDRKVIHHDLTGGNLLVTKAEGKLTIHAIDIGRATIYSKKEVSEQQRLLDLMRCCYKLDWPNRERFMAYYIASYGRSFTRNWRRAIAYYDWKIQTKKRLKRLIKGKWSS